MTNLMCFWLPWCIPVCVLGSGSLSPLRGAGNVVNVLTARRKLQSGPMMVAEQPFLVTVG